MAKELAGKRIAFLATDGVEQVELTKPWDAIRAAGADVELLSIHDGKIQGMNHIDKGDTFEVDELVAEADPGRLRRPRAAGRRGESGSPAHG